jgi:uncharacterized protein (DUF433 family)
MLSQSLEIGNQQNSRPSHRAIRAARLFRAHIAAKVALANVWIYQYIKIEITANFESIRCFFNIINRENIMAELNRITTDPQLCGGHPCIRHMRIRVKDILDLLAAGASTEEILEDYPYLEAGDIQAALEYAAHQMDHSILNVA